MVIILLFYLWGMTQQASSPILIIENPSQFEIRDRFEKQIEQTDHFAKNTPFFILRKTDFLSDQITACMTVENNGNRYFILTKNGNPLTKGQRARQATIEDYTRIEKGAKLKNNGNVKMTEPFTGKSLNLNPERLNIIFQSVKGLYTYSESDRQYFWIESLGNGTFPIVYLEKLQEVNPPVQMDQAIPVVQSFLSTVNAKSTAITSIFNQVYNQSHASFSADFEKIENRLIITFSGDMDSESKNNIARFLANRLRRNLPSFTVTHFSDQTIIVISVP